MSITRFADKVLRSTEPAVAANIIEACRAKRRWATSESASERRYLAVEQAHRLTQAASIVHPQLSAGTLSKIAANLAERIA